MSDEEKIEALNYSNKQRTRLWDQYKTYLDQLDAELQDSSKDPFESHLAHRVMLLAHHVNFGLSQKSSMDTTDLLKASRIKNLEESHKPNAGQYALVALQIASAFAAGALGIGGYAPVSAAVSGVGVGGSQALGGILQSHKQGNQAFASFELEADKRKQQEHDQSRQLAQQSRQRSLDEEQQAQSKKDRAIEMILSGTAG